MVSSISSSSLLLLSPSRMFVRLCNYIIIRKFNILFFPKIKIRYDSTPI